MTKPLTMDEIIEAHLRLLAEAAHKARQETLAEVQAHVRAERDAETGDYEGVPGFASVDIYLSDALVEHAGQDPEGRALAEGILERKASRE